MAKQVCLGSTVPARVSCRAAPGFMSVVILADGAGLCPATESRNPVIDALRAFTPAVESGIPARASQVEARSLGRDDIPFAGPFVPRPHQHLVYSGVAKS